MGGFYEDNYGITPERETYIVSPKDSPNLEVEADGYKMMSGDYMFVQGKKVIATVPLDNVLHIIVKGVVNLPQTEEKVEEVS